MLIKYVSLPDEENALPSLSSVTFPLLFVGWASLVPRIITPSLIAKPL